MIRQLRFKALAFVLGLAATIFGACATIQPAKKEVKVTPVPHKPVYSVEDVANALKQLQNKVDGHVLRIERLELELAATRCKCECKPDCCKPAAKPAAKPAPAKPAPAKVQSCPGGVCPSPSRSRSRGFGRLNLWR
jgi:hypothetical protein